MWVDIRGEGLDAEESKGVNDEVAVRLVGLGTNILHVLSCLCCGVACTSQKVLCSNILL